MDSTPLPGKQASEWLTWRGDHARSSRTLLFYKISRFRRGVLEDRFLQTDRIFDRELSLLGATLPALLQARRNAHDVARLQPLIGQDPRHDGITVDLPPQQFCLRHSEVYKSRTSPRLALMAVSLERLPHRLDQLGLGLAEEVMGDSVQLPITLRRNGLQAGLEVRKVVEVSLATRIEGAKQDLQRFEMGQHLLPGVVDRRIEGGALLVERQKAGTQVLQERSAFRAPIDSEAKERAFDPPLNVPILSRIWRPLRQGYGVILPNGLSDDRSRVSFRGWHGAASPQGSG
jgi:hypothetical protein